MSLVTNLSDFATRVGTEIKTVYSKVGALTSLTTSAKTNLVDAINEVNASVAGASGINDSTTSTSTSWSSSKTASEIADASSDDRDRANHTNTQAATTVDETSTRKWFSDVERTKLTGIATGATANATDAYLLDLANHTGTLTHTAISDWDGSVDSRISTVLGIDNAPALLNDINELAAALNDDANFGSNVLTALSNRVRFDAAQSLTSPQALQARSNIGAPAASDIGDVTTNFVTVFENALV